MVKTLAELRKKCPKCAKISTILTRSNTAQKLTRFQVIVHGMWAKLVTSYEQNMLHTKS